MNKRFSTITTAIALSAGAILSPMSASAEEQKDLNVTYFISHIQRMNLIQLWQRRWKRQLKKRGLI